MVFALPRFLGEECVEVEDLNSAGTTYVRKSVIVEELSVVLLLSTGRQDLPLWQEHFSPYQGDHRFEARLSRAFQIGTVAAWSFASDGLFVRAASAQAL
jgi:hypothetical protein